MFAEPGLTGWGPISSGMNQSSTWEFCSSQGHQTEHHFGLWGLRLCPAPLRVDTSQGYGCGGLKLPGPLAHVAGGSALGGWHRLSFQADTLGSFLLVCR